MRVAVDPLLRRERLAYPLRRRIQLYVPDGTIEPIHSTILREVIVDDAEKDPSASDHTCVVHVRGARLWRGGEHDNDDGEYHPKDGYERRRWALGRKCTVSSRATCEDAVTYKFTE